jgi:hypothetical protein
MIVINIKTLVEKLEVESANSSVNAIRDSFTEFLKSTLPELKDKEAVINIGSIVLNLHVREFKDKT